MLLVWNALSLPCPLMRKLSHNRSSRMLQKGWAASVVLLCVIVIFTILTAGFQPKPILIGRFAEFLIPALLTIYLFILLYSARIIMDVLAGFLLGNRQQGAPRGNSWAVLVGYAIGAVLIVLLIRSMALQSIMGAVEAAVSSTASFLRIGQGEQAKSLVSTESPYLFYYIAIVFGAIVLVSFVLLLGGVRTAYRWTREERSLIDPDVLRRETLQVVQRAARELKVTGDYRGTILNCYREMCRVLSLHGFRSELYETAGEFSRTVSQKLGLGGESVRGLTLLFEEARYSDHWIDDDKRAEALNQLESLERSLDDVGR